MLHCCCSFPLILLASRSDWAGLWERKMRRQRLWPYFPFTGFFTARDIESLSCHTYESPYFIHLFVSSNYSEGEHWTQSNTWWTWAAFMSVCHLNTKQSCAKTDRKCANNIMYIDATLIHDIAFSHKQQLFPVSSKTWEKSLKKSKNIELFKKKNECWKVRN